MARGLFAALLKGARGASAALSRDARGATAVFCSNARGVHFLTPAFPPEGRRSYVSSSVREQVGSLLCRSGRSKVRRCNARVPCVPPRFPEASARAAANSTAFSVASCTVSSFPPAAMGGFSRWAESQKGGDGNRAPRPGSRGGGSSRRELTPNKGGGRQAPRGSDWSRGAAFDGSEDVWSEAFRLDRRARKTRIDYSRPAFLRALQGHSADCGHELSCMAAPLDESAVADLQRSHGKYIYHGTDVHVVEGIVAQGLLPGGGPGGRLANHFVVGNMPTQWSEARGFRRGSNAVVQCGVRLFYGADGVLLADAVPPEAIFRILAADNQRGAYTEVMAEIGTDRRLHLVRDLRAEAVEAAAAAMSAAAAPGPAAPAEGAEADEADTEESSSDSDLPDTTAPAVGKTEEQSGAAEAAPHLAGRAAYK